MICASIRFEQRPAGTAYVGRISGDCWKPAVGDRRLVGLEKNGASVFNRPMACFSRDCCTHHVKKRKLVIDNTVWDV